VKLSVKFSVPLLVGLLLATSQARYAGRLSHDPGKPFNGTNQVNFTAHGLSSSSPRVNSVDESAPAKSKFITIDGTRLHFVIKGAGRPVVLIHGNPGSTQDWARVFGMLPANLGMIAFDRPGHGRSQRPKHEVATVEVQARLLHEALGQLHVERPILVGHSWGGALALVYAINYPKEVAGLVLVAPAVYESQDGVSFLTKLPAVPVIGDAVNFVLTPLFGASVVRKDLKKAFSPDPVPKNYLRSVLSEWTRPKRVKAYAVDDSLLSDCLKKFSPRYSEIEAPISILAGDSDLIVPEKENAERLHKALPKSQFVLLPKTGHEIPFTRPQALIDALNYVASLR
jgi:pimeloyl-ACP methyl ester carboxylesterase